MASLLSNNSPLFAPGSSAIISTVAALLTANALFLANWSCVDTLDADEAVTNTVCRDLKAHHSDAFDTKYPKHSYGLISTFEHLVFVLIIMMFLRDVVFYGTMPRMMTFSRRTASALLNGLTLVLSCLGWFIYLTHHPLGDEVIAAGDSLEEHTGQGVYSAVFTSVLLVIPFVGSILVLESV